MSTQSIPWARSGGMHSGNSKEGSFGPERIRQTERGMGNRVGYAPGLGMGGKEEATLGLGAPNRTGSRVVGLSVPEAGRRKQGQEEQKSAPGMLLRSRLSGENHSLLDLTV